MWRECQPRKGFRKAYGSGRWAVRQIARARGCRALACRRFAADPSARGAGQSAVSRDRPSSDGRNAARRGPQGRRQGSLATVYNTLHQFTEVGLLAGGGGRPALSYFDTNIDEHQHFYVEDEGLLIDIPGGAIEWRACPQPPKGTAVDRVDVVVRLKRN